MFNLHVNVIKNTINYDEVFDFVALGLGPSSLSAGIYAIRKGLKTLLVGDELGGQLKNTTDVDNYLGFSFVKAEELIASFKKHLDNLEVPMVTGVRVIKIEKVDELFLVSLNNRKIVRSKTLLYALGGNPRKLNLQGEEKYSGKGVSYCVTCDGPFFKNKNIVVAGGGNSALDGALDLAKTARQVTIIQRSNIKGDKKVLDHILKLPNVQIKEETLILELIGSDKLQALKILDKASGKESIFETDALFVEIGNIPNTDLVKDLIPLTSNHEITVDQQGMTSLEGLYAAGDVVVGSKRQIIIAAGEGAKVAINAAAYINNYKGRK